MLAKPQAQLNKFVLTDLEKRMPKNDNQKWESQSPSYITDATIWALKVLYFSIYSVLLYRCIVYCIV